jgi:aspartate dehydrogenase
MTVEPSVRSPFRYGLIGFGRIGQRIAARLAAREDGPRSAAVLTRPGGRAAGTVAQVVGVDSAVADLDGLLAAAPEVVVECASPETLAAFGPQLLAAGIDLIPLSLAALADRAVEHALLAAATVGPGRLEIAAGAVGSCGRYRRCT